MTDTHEIDGVTYHEVKRKAEVGEKIIVVDAFFGGGLYRNGDIFTVRESIKNGVSIASAVLLDVEYRVLEPKPVLLDIVANLTRRVTELEAEVRKKQPEIISVNITQHVEGSPSADCIAQTIKRVLGGDCE